MNFGVHMGPFRVHMDAKGGPIVGLHEAHRKGLLGPLGPSGPVYLRCEIREQSLYVRSEVCIREQSLHLRADSAVAIRDPKSRTESASASRVCI